MLKIKEYYFTTGTTFKSIKTLEDAINGTGGYFESTTAPYYKLIRGCIVSDTEYTSLNYDPVEGIISEIGYAREKKNVKKMIKEHEDCIQLLRAQIKDMEDSVQRFEDLLTRRKKEDE